LEVCTNYRYARRHDSALTPLNSQRKDDGKQASKATDLKSPKAKPIVKPVKGPKKNQKANAEEAKIAEEAAAAEAAEKARKKAEQEAAEKEAIEAKRDAQRPKTYQEEEKNQWREYVSQFWDSFGELIQRREQAQSSKTSTQVQKEEENQEETESAPTPRLGSRTITEINVEYNFPYLCEHVCSSVVPEPIWPDPDKEPLPAPAISSILKKPPTRSERAKIDKFKILTPTGEVDADGKPITSDSITRWVLQPKETKKLFLKFFSKKIGTFSETL
jgi:hypothetical protein